MALGKAEILLQNLGQGSVPSVSRLALFVGTTATSNGSVQTISADTDLQTLYGDASGGTLRTQLEGAIQNGGSGWMGYAIDIAAAANWDAAITTALNAGYEFSYVVFTDDAADQAALEAYQTRMATELSAQNPIFCIASARAIDDTPSTGESWATYLTAMNTLAGNASAERVLVVPKLFPSLPGALAGRLANPKASIADSPMRVATGPMVGLGDKPVDEAGVMITTANLTTLDQSGLSVPQWYQGIPGIYFADGNMLAAPTSDFGKVETLRIADELARKLYPMAVQRIADRKLNQTALSIASHKTYFGKPLRELSKSVVIAGETFPGAIQPPQDGDITITWTDTTTVVIGYAFRPFNSPKTIQANIAVNTQE